MARKKKTIHYLYKTTCLITGRYYIGMHSTNNLNDGYMGSGRRLRASIRKHGEINHTKEILEFFDSRELLVEAEIKAITPEMITDKNCMNLMGGGDGGYVSKEHYQKTSKIGGKAHADRMKIDEEYRVKTLNQLNENRLKAEKNGSFKGLKRFEGKTHSEETKKKISEIKKQQGIGKNNSQYGTCWVTKHGLNKKIKKEDLETHIKQGWERGRK